MSAVSVGYWAVFFWGQIAFWKWTLLFQTVPYFRFQMKSESGGGTGKSDLVSGLVNIITTIRQFVRHCVMEGENAGLWLVNVLRMQYSAVNCTLVRVMACFVHLTARLCVSRNEISVRSCLQSTTTTSSFCQCVH